ncbi:MAG: ATP-binding cassette domain-containing protein [Blastocatellia bacterium]|nr:ATP-binding cassette domain-containing protein [Blastocatellia bacterium]
MDELLKIENVSKSFSLNDGETLQVLSKVNLTIDNIPDKPQIISILGPSGGGKTTLLRILAGLDNPIQGA